MENIRQYLASSSSRLGNLRQSLLYGAPSVVVLFLLYVLSVELMLRGSITKQLNETESVFSRHFESFKADVDFLNIAPAAEPLRLLMPSTGKDAGKILNEKVFWSPSPNSETVRFGRSTPLVTKDSQEFLLRYHDDWIKGRSFVESGRLKADTSLFSELHQFDVWDIESNSPLEELARSRKFVPHNFLPSPDTLDIISAAKVRLLKGTLDGQPLEALKQTRKLAGLLLTTEYMPLLLTGLTLLDLERRAYREYVDRGWILESAWQPLPTKLIARARRAWIASASYLSILNPESRLRSLLSLNTEKTSDGALNLPSGFCAAINYRLPNELSFRDQLTGLWPFERTFRPNYEALDAIVARASSRCRLKLFTALYAPSILGGSAFESVDPSGIWPLPNLPYFRTLFALRDMAAWPIHFDAYARKD